MPLEPSSSTIDGSDILRVSEFRSEFGKEQEGRSAVGVRVGGSLEGYVTTGGDDSKWKMMMMTGRKRRRREKEERETEDGMDGWTEERRMAG